MRIDDGHPLRPIAAPLVPPRARVHAATSSPPAATDLPAVTLEYIDGILRPVRDDVGLVSLAGPPPEDSLRTDAEAATAWVELRPTAWLITRESGGLVHASDLVYRLLERTPEQLASVLDDPGDSTPGFAWIRRAVIAEGRAAVVLRIRLASGAVREVDVVSQRLPRRPGAEDHYFSVLTAREG